MSSSRSSSSRSQKTKTKTKSQTPSQHIAMALFDMVRNETTNSDEIVEFIKNNMTKLRDVKLYLIGDDAALLESFNTNVEDGATLIEAAYIMALPQHQKKLKDKFIFQADVLNADYDEAKKTKAYQVCQIAANNEIPADMSPLDDEGWSHVVYLLLSDQTEKQKILKTYSPYHLMEEKGLFQNNNEDQDIDTQYPSIKVQNNMSNIASFKMKSVTQQKTPSIKAVQRPSAFLSIRPHSAVSRSRPHSVRKVNGGKRSNKASSKIHGTSLATSSHL